MVKLGLSVLLMAVVKVALIIAAVIGAAAALTHYVALPEPLGTLTWVIAIGYSLLCLASLGLVVGALVVATKEPQLPSSRIRAPKRRLR